MISVQVHLFIPLLCDKIFLGEMLHPCLLTPDCEPTADQTRDIIKVQLGGVLLEILTGIWVRGHLQEQK